MSVSNHTVRDPGRRWLRREPADPKAAVGALFDTEFDDLFRFCVLRVGSVARAEDIVSETFADALRTVAADPHAVVDRPWLFVTARRRMIDQWRRDDRERRRVRRALLERAVDGHDTQERADDDAVLTALDTLSDRQRYAVILRYVDGYSVQDVADQLGLSYPAAESLLARGRRQFAGAYRSDRSESGPR